MTESTSAVWADGYETAIANALYLIHKEFSNATLGIKKAIRLIEGMGDPGMTAPYIMWSASCSCGRILGPTVKTALAEAISHHKRTCPEWGNK